MRCSCRPEMSRNNKHVDKVPTGVMQGQGVVTEEIANITGLSYRSALSPEDANCHTTGQQLLLNNQIQQPPTNSTLQMSQSSTNSTFQTSQSPTNCTLQMSLCETVGSLSRLNIALIPKDDFQRCFQQCQDCWSKGVCAKGLLFRGAKGRLFYILSLLKMKPELQQILNPPLDK